jgi:hypothetical protein
MNDFLIPYEQDVCDSLSYTLYIKNNFENKKVTLFYFNEKKIVIENQSFKDYYRLSQHCCISNVSTNGNYIELQISKDKGKCGKFIQLKIDQNSFVSFVNIPHKEHELLFSIFVSEKDGTIEKLYYYNQGIEKDKVVLRKVRNEIYYKFSKNNFQKFFSLCIQHSGLTIYSFLKEITWLSKHIILHLICLSKISMKTLLRELDKKQIYSIYLSLGRCVEKKVACKVQQLQISKEEGNPNIINSYIYDIEKILIKNQTLLAKQFHP